MEDGIVKFSKMYPTITKGEAKLFLKFLLKHNLYDGYVSAILGDFCGKPIASASGHHLLERGYLYIDDAEKRIALIAEWHTEYKKAFYKPLLKEWEYHVLEIMAKHDIPFSQYYEGQCVLYAPIRAEASIKKYMKKRFSQRLTRFTGLRVSTDWRGQLWLRMEFSMFPNIHID